MHWKEFPDDPIAPHRRRHPRLAQLRPRPLADIVVGQAAFGAARRVADRTQGALLVAPADPERRGVLADFAPVPYQRLPYPSILVASTNDPYCPVRTAGAYARAWGSEFVRLNSAGHINVESGHGPWPLGLALLASLGADVKALTRATEPA